MNHQKLNPSEDEIYTSAKEALAWREKLGLDDCVPNGWKTREELEKMLGFKKSNLGLIITNAIKEGKIERKDFHIKRQNRRCLIPHYFLK
jgi:hypothetical protein